MCVGVPRVPIDPAQFTGLHDGPNQRGYLLLNAPFIDDVHHAVRSCCPLDLTNALDVRDLSREIDQMVAHDGPEFLARAFEDDEVAEGFQVDAPGECAARNR
jgi:hypothetical protein